ncbi:MAG: hypothetical protein QHC89_08455 [Bosea sp. (in: a-proteobacteria)]|nr:hypothetical protein [Bosea sp. (in: a-proteobacteria)]
MGNGIYTAEVQIELDGIEDMNINIDVHASGYGQVEKAVYKQIAAIGNAIAVAGHGFSAGTC